MGRSWGDRAVEVGGLWRLGSIVVRLGFLGTEEDKAEAARREATL